MNLAVSEVDDIVAVVKAEHIAFWMGDHEGYERCHLHAPYTKWWSYWRHGGPWARGLAAPGTAAFGKPPTITC